MAIDDGERTVVARDKEDSIAQRVRRCGFEIISYLYERGKGEASGRLRHAMGYMIKQTDLEDETGHLGQGKRLRSYRFIQRATS